MAPTGLQGLSCYLQPPSSLVMTQINASKTHHFTPTTDLHRLASLNTLEDRRNAHLLNLMFDRKDDPYFCDNRNLPTRRFDATILKVPQFHKATSKKAVAYRGATSWNSLPPDIRCIPSKDAFKRFQKSAMTGIT